VTTFDTLEEAIATANDSYFDLAATGWTHDINRAPVCVALHAGFVHVNQAQVAAPNISHSGYKRSGLGTPVHLRKLRGAQERRHQLRMSDQMTCFVMVLPHILEGVALLGIAFVMATLFKRQPAWTRPGRDLRPQLLADVTRVEPVSKATPLPNASSSTGRPIGVLPSDGSGKRVMARRDIYQGNSVTAIATTRPGSCASSKDVGHP
jgi:Aldehyde dehydrogenase family